MERVTVIFELQRVTGHLSLQLSRLLQDITEFNQIRHD